VLTSCRPDRSATTICDPAGRDPVEACEVAGPERRRGGERRQQRRRDGVFAVDRVGGEARQRRDMLLDRAALRRGAIERRGRAGAARGDDQGRSEHHQASSDRRQAGDARNALEPLHPVPPREQGRSEQTQPLDGAAQTGPGGAPEIATRRPCGGRHAGSSDALRRISAAETIGRRTSTLAKCLLFPTHLSIDSAAVERSSFASPLGDPAHSAVDVLDHRSGGFQQPVALDRVGRIGGSDQALGGSQPQAQLASSFHLVPHRDC